MRNYLLGATAIAATLICAGYLVQKYVFSEEPQSSESVSLGDAGALTGAEATDASVPDASVPLDVRALVVAASGTAERHAAGDWVGLRSGEELALSDQIRTGRDGQVTLQMSGAEVRLDSDTRVTVLAVDAAVARVQLATGRVEASVTGAGNPRLGVEVADSDTVAETASGEFVVLSPGDGNATVAAYSGSVAVRAGGESVTVEPGRQTVVRRHQAPLPPAEIPGSLFLKLDRKSAEVATKRRYTIRGQTAPGATLTVQGERLFADENGEFVAVVALREGDNRIRIRTLDVKGRTKQSVNSVELDTQGPDVSGQVDWENPQ